MHFRPFWQGKRFCAGILKFEACGNQWQFLAHANPSGCPCPYVTPQHNAIFAYVCMSPRDLAMRIAFAFVLPGFGY